MWTNLNFSKKVWLLAFVFMLFSLITGAGYHFMSNQIRNIGIESSKNEMLNAYKNELKDMVDVMAVSLASASEGETQENVLQSMYSTLLKDARFYDDKSGYFFVAKKGGEILVHPAKPSLQGKNIFNLKDPTGHLFVQSLEKAALSGGDFVEYQFDKPGKGVQPKLSYSSMIPDRDYWIGTGVYIDDITEKEMAISQNMDSFSKDYLIKLFGVIAAVFFLIILPLTLFMIKSMVVPLTKLTDMAVEYSRGKPSTEFTDIDRKDEVGALSRAVQRLGRSTEIALQKLQEK